LLIEKMGVPLGQFNKFRIKLLVFC